MVSITVEENIIEILKAFLEDKINDPLKLLNSFDSDNFNFSLKYNKYDSCINIHVAKTIVNFQESIYRIAAYSICGKLDIRYLSREKKEQIEIPFRINSGSTVINTSNLINSITRLLKMLPEKYRSIVLVGFLLIFLSPIVCFGFNKYLEFRKYKIDSNLQLEKEKIQSQERLEIYNKALNKVGQESPPLKDIIEKQAESQLKNLSNIDEEIELNGEVFTKEKLVYIIEQVKKNSAIDKDMQYLTGNFYLVSVNFNPSFISVKNIVTNEKIKILFSEYDLFDHYSENLHKALDKNTSIFKIDYYGTENKYHLKNIENVE